MFINIAASSDPNAPRVLVVAPDNRALPDLCPTDDGGEIQAMSEELANVLHIDALIGTVNLTGKGSLSDALRDGNYKILHLIAHGARDGIALTTEYVKHERLSRLLGEHDITLVLAMTCNSAAYAEELVRTGTPQTIATIGDIQNIDARVFSREFYSAFARGMNVREATDFARSRMAPEAAKQIVLLPDEATAEQESLFKEFSLLRNEITSLREDLRKHNLVMNEWAAKLSTHEDVQALTQAVVSLAKVLSR